MCARGRPPREQRPEQQNRADERELAEIDADVEREERERDLAGRQADLCEGTCEAESVEETEEQRQRPREAAQEGAVSRVASQLDGERQPAEGDQQLDGP